MSASWRAGGADGGQPGRVPGVGAFEPGGVEAGQEVRAVGGRSGWGGDGQGQHGLGDVGVVGGVPGAGVDHLEQGDGQVAGRQVPQRDRGLIGPDRHPAGTGGVEQAAGAGGLGAGVGSAFAVQHQQQRARRALAAWWAWRAAAYHPAQVRIIRFVFPLPDAPMTT